MRFKIGRFAFVKLKYDGSGKDRRKFIEIESPYNIIKFLRAERFLILNQKIP